MHNDTFVIEGGKKLSGEIIPSGNKNEALAVIAAVLLTEDEVILKNVPEIIDTSIMIEIVNKLGADVKKIAQNEYSFKAKTISSSSLDIELSSKIRSSLLVMGPLLNRCNSVVLPSSGGDKIGKRRIDTHILALKQFGVDISFENECRLDTKGLKGAYILLDEASVMATENAVMAAVLAKGETTIYNAACEPHVQGLCNMLNSMGAKISGVGTNRLDILGVKKLKGCTHKILPDHIEIGSFIGLAIATKSDLTIKGGHNEHMDIIYPAFEKIGVKFDIDGSDIIVKSNQDLVINDDFGGKIPSISDQPWPCFPADLTSIMVVTSLFSKGTILIHEKLFEGRLFFTDSLIRMGGKMVLCDPHRIVITGPNELTGVELSSPDIRAGMALLIAALAANGESVIHNVRQIDRGYQDIDKRLQQLGASINRIS